MNVLIFCTAKMDIGSGSEIRGRLISKGLAKLGVNVTVVTQSVPKEFSDLGIHSFTLDTGVTWTDLLRQAAKKNKPDIVYGITEGSADEIARFSEEINCHLAYDMHGIGIVEILELGRGYGSRVTRLKNSRKWLRSMNKAQFITVANPALVSIAKIIYGKKKIKPVIGLTETDHFTPEGPKARIAKQPEKVQVLYIGNFFKWQGIDLFLQAAQKVLEVSDCFEFSIIGSVGKEIFQNQTLLKKYNFINYYDSVDYETIPEYMRAADVLVLPRPFMFSTHLAFPQKIVDYMATGRAIVSTNLNPHSWALKNPPCGLLCDPNPGDMMKAILETQDPHLRETLSLNARKKAENEFNYLMQSKKILSILENL
jgi:glycosyltransferase involved in cell wall biosynthesis